MTKKHELAKRALKHPELFTPAELEYFKLWLRQRKIRKREEKLQKKDDGSTYLK